MIVWARDRRSSWSTARSAADRSGRRRNWRRMARDFTVFAYDRRGRGDSGDTAPYAVEREIEDLAALVRQAGGSACVHAMSSGAVLALHAAASGLSIKRLALYEPPFMVGTPAHLPPADHQAQLVRLIAEGRRGEAVKYYMKDIIGMPGLLVAVFRFLPMWSKLKAVAPSLPYDSAIMGDFSLPTRRAASLTLPTLVITGEKSMPVLRDAAARLAEVIPGARSRTLLGQTHNVSAQALAPVLKEFFAP